MRLVRWSFENLHIPMMEDEQGTLYCTSHALRSALQVEEHTFNTLYYYHKKEFEGLSIISNDTKDFLRQHKTEFGIRRLRKDMHIWSEGDMILIAVLSRSPVGAEFRKGVIELIKRNALKNYVSQEEHEALEARNRELEELVAVTQPALETAASAAGAVLQAQKGTKHLRLLKS